VPFGSFLVSLLETAKFRNQTREKEVGPLQDLSQCLLSYVHNTTNSAYHMAEQILSQQQPLCGSLVVATFSPASLQTTLHTR